MNFYQVLPNIWICIVRPDYIKRTPNINLKAILQEFARKNSITKSIKAHKDLDFFGRSNQYIDIIREQMERDEIKKLYNYLLKTTKTLFDYYCQGENSLIISGVDINKSIAIITTFLIKYADMTVSQSIKSIQSKIKDNIIIPGNYQKTLMLVEKMNKE